MWIDTLDENWITTIGPRRVSAILAANRSSLLGWTREVYENLLPEALVPSSIVTHTPQGNRFIDMFAFVNGFAAGTKLIASHPKNLEYGNPRAYSVIVCSRVEGEGETEAGRPIALVHGSEITAARTTLGACLVAQQLRPTEWFREARVAYIGCGNIARSFASFWAQHLGVPKSVAAFDIKTGVASKFLEEMQSAKYFPQERAQSEAATSCAAALKGADVVCFATTAKEPHVTSICETAPDALILHLSLRDLKAEDILSCANVTDIVEHACSHATSLALAKKEVGHTNFIDCTVTQLLTCPATAPQLRNKRVVFSPFGMALLDIYFAKQVHKQFEALPLGEFRNVE